MKYDFFYITNIYTSDECAEIRKIVEQYNDPTIEDKPADGVTKTSTVKCIHWEYLNDALSKMHNMTVTINNDYFGFDLYQPTLYDILHYNEYDYSSGAEYAWHKDAAKNQCFDLKLTALLNLSPFEYEGGNFELFLNGPTEIKEFSKQGTLLVFPSWTQHRVTAVTSGHRITLTKFYKGPNFK